MRRSDECGTDTRCHVAERMAGVDVTHGQDACAVCVTHQSEHNLVTASLAIKAARERASPERSAEVLKQWRHLIMPRGVGTRFKRILAEMGFRQGSCGCQEIEARMNQLGPVGCERDIKELAAEIRRSAASHSWLGLLASHFPSVVIRGLIAESIRQERVGA